MFMGTPHRGSDLASYGNVLAGIATMVMNKPRSRLLDALRTNSDELLRIAQEFRFQISAYQISTFYELQPMKPAKHPVSLPTTMEIDGRQDAKSNIYTGCGKTFRFT